MLYTYNILYQNNIFECLFTMILLNHDLLKNNSYVLKPGDIFSIRRFGKYKYVGVIKNTKKDNYIIKCLKYL